MRVAGLIYFLYKNTTYRKAPPAEVGAAAAEKA